jgi:hypothetical protein
MQQLDVSLELQRTGGETLESPTQVEPEEVPALENRLELPAETESQNSGGSKPSGETDPIHSFDKDNDENEDQKTETKTDPTKEMTEFETDTKYENDDQESDEETSDQVSESEESPEKESKCSKTFSQMDFVSNEEDLAIRL